MELASFQEFNTARSHLWLGHRLILGTISIWQLPLSDGTVRARLDDLLAKVHAWNTFDWYGSDRFPAIERSSS
ncbi:MAG: hypothetical protein ACRDT0_27035 [Pseudonocardiaceae bacterium]